MPSYGKRPVGAKPACWRWKPPADIGAVLLAEEMRRQWLERHGEVPRLRKYVDQQDEQARWVLLRRWHKNRCAICGTSKRYNDGLVTDHDHGTGWIRGFLCRSCNTLEGCGHRGAFDLYRERPPAVICGVRLEYVGGWGAMAIVPSAPPEPQEPVCRPPGATDSAVVSALALAAIWNTETVTAADCRDYAEGRADLLAQAAEHLITSWTRWDLAQRIAGVRLFVEAGADESLIDGWPELKALADPAA